MNSTFFQGRDGVLLPTKWYYPSASSGPVPCRWEGYVSGQYFRIDLFGV